MQDFFVTSDINTDELQLRRTLVLHLSMAAADSPQQIHLTVENAKQENKS